MSSTGEPAAKKAKMDEPQEVGENEEVSAREEEEEEEEGPNDYENILAKCQAHQATTLTFDRPFEDDDIEDDNFKPKWEAIGAELLKDGAVVTDLEFSYGCWGFRELLKYLASNKKNTNSIRRVSLENVGELEGGMLGAAFETPPPDFDADRELNEFAALIARAFPALESLELFELGVHSFAPFLEALQTSSTFRMISLASLNLAESEPSFLALGTFLKTSRSICEIQIDSLSCDAEDNKEKWQEAVEELAAGIRATTSLETLNLGMLEVNDAQKGMLEATWKNHATLKNVEAELVTDPAAHLADLKQEIEASGVSAGPPCAPM